MSELNTRNEILPEDQLDRSSFFKKFWDFLFGSSVGVSAASTITAAAAPTSAFATPSAVVGSTIGNVASSTILPGIAKGALALGTTSLGALPAAPLVIAASAVVAYKTIDYTIKTDASRFDKKYKKILEDQEINQYIRGLDHFLFRIKESMRGMSKFNQFTNLTTHDNYCKLYLKVSRKKPIFDGLFKEILDAQLKNIRELQKRKEYKIKNQPKDAELKNIEDQLKAAEQKFIDFNKYSVGFSNKLSKKQEVQYKHEAWQFRDKEKNELRDSLCEEALKYYEQYIGVLEMAIFLYKLVHYKYSVFLLNKRCIRKDSKNANAPSYIKYFDTQRWKNAIAESQKDKKNRYVSGFNDIFDNIKAKGADEFFIRPGYDDIKNMVEEKGTGIYQLNIDNKEDCKTIAGSAWIDGYVELVLNKYHRMPDVALLERTAGQTSAFKIMGLRDIEQFKKCPKDATQNYNKDVPNSFYNRIITNTYIKPFLDGKSINSESDHKGLLEIRKQQIYIMDYLGEIIDSLVEWVQVIPDKNDINAINEINKNKKMNRFNYGTMKLNELIKNFVFIERYIDKSHFDLYTDAFAEIIYGKDIDFKSFNIHKGVDGSLDYNDKQYYDICGNKIPIKRMGLIQLDIEINKLLSAYGKADKEDSDRELKKYYDTCGENKPWAKSWQDKYLPDFLSYKNSKKQALTEIKDFEEQIKKVNYSTIGSTYHSTSDISLPLDELYIIENGNYKRSKYNKMNNQPPADDKTKYYEKRGITFVEWNTKESGLSNLSQLSLPTNSYNLYSSSSSTSSLSTGQNIVNLEVATFNAAIESNVKTTIETLKSLKIQESIPITYYNYKIWNVIDALYILIGNEKEKYSKAYTDLITDNKLKLKDDDKKKFKEIYEKYMNLTDKQKNPNFWTSIVKYTFKYDNSIPENKDNTRFNITNQFLESWIPKYVHETSITDKEDLDIIRYYLTNAFNPDATKRNIFISKEIGYLDNKLKNRYAEFVSKIWKDYDAFITKYRTLEWIKIDEADKKDKFNKIKKIYYEHLIKTSKDIASKKTDVYKTIKNSNVLKPIIEKLNPNINKTPPSGADIMEVLNTFLDQNETELLIQYISEKGIDLSLSDLRFGMTQWHPGLVVISENCGGDKQNENTLFEEYNKTESIGGNTKKSKAYYTIYALTHTDNSFPPDSELDKQDKPIYSTLVKCIKRHIEGVVKSTGSGRTPIDVAVTLAKNLIESSKISDTKNISKPTNSDIKMKFSGNQNQNQNQNKNQNPNPKPNLDFNKFSNILKIGPKNQNKPNQTKPNQ
jgi:hypothetical protein